MTEAQQACIAALAEARVIPVLRADRAETGVKIAGRLISAGVGAVELTTTIPDWPDVLTEVVRAGRAAPQPVTIGMGTVLDADMAELAIDRGADFLVSPFPAPGVRGPALDADMLFVEGGVTPAEIADAASRGVAKLFPAHLGGLAYLKTLRSILPDARIIPTGGISVDQVGTWLAAGALAVGVGRDLYESDDIVAALRRARGSVPA